MLWHKHYLYKTPEEQTSLIQDAATVTDMVWLKDNVRERLYMCVEKVQ